MKPGAVVRVPSPFKPHLYKHAGKWNYFPVEVKRWPGLSARRHYGGYLNARAYQYCLTNNGEGTNA